MDKTVIRTAVLSDTERLLEIYAYYVENTTITFKYDVPSVMEFQNRMEKILQKYPYIVAQQNNRIVGYAYAGSFVGRKAYDWSAELTVYVDKNYHRCGIGRELYKVLEDILKKMGITNWCRSCRISYHIFLIFKVEMSIIHNFLLLLPYRF